MNTIRLLAKHAIYEGTEYEFSSNSDGTCDIYSTDPACEKRGFARIDMSGHALFDSDRFVRTVNLCDLDFIFETKASVIYKGDKFEGTSIKRGQINIYTWIRGLSEKYGMDERGRGDYWRYVDLKDVDNVQIEWHPLARYMTDAEGGGGDAGAAAFAIKAGKAALFKSRAYEFRDRVDGDCAIASRDPRDEAGGFEPVKIFKGWEGFEMEYVKAVAPEELDFVFERGITAIYQGEEREASAIEGDRITLAPARPGAGQERVRLRYVEKVIERWVPLAGHARG